MKNVNPTLEQDLDNVLNDYQSSLSNVEKRRDYWETKLKNLLIETLEEIAEKANEISSGSATNGTWFVQRLDETINYQTINLSISSRHSGIVERERDMNTKEYKKVKALTKKGGYIAFSQSYTGRINVIVDFPSIEKWVMKQNHIVLETVEPQNISADWIVGHVIRFFKEMAIWEGKKE